MYAYRFNKSTILLQMKHVKNYLIIIQERKMVSKVFYQFKTTAELE
jgi:hypothetical protein